MTMNVSKGCNLYWDAFRDLLTQKLVGAKNVQQGIS